MATAISYTREDLLTAAEQLLGKLNGVFMARSEICYEDAASWRAEVSRLKIEIHGLGFGLRQDHTGWRLA